jgi:gliding motility-associated-like protein
MNKLPLPFLVLLFTLQATGQVKINEYSVSNSTLTTGTVFTDNTGNSPDWVELYNAGSSVASIGGWNMSDDPNKINKYAFPSGTSIPAGGFLRIWCSGKGDPSNTSGHIHTNFKLTQCKGDWIVLMNGSNLVDTLRLQKTQVRHSRGRSPDGSTTWKVYTIPTPNASNTGTGYDGYAPTPTLSPGAGFYSSAQSVSISVPPSSGLTVHYTTDGSEPTTSSSVYATTPVSIPTTSVVRAYAVSSNASVLPGFMETNTYLINESINAQYGVVSISGGNKLDQLMSGMQNEPPTHFEYFENGAFVTETYGLSNKHGNDSWAYDQRGIDFETKDDYGYNYALLNKFFTDPKMGKSKRKEFQHVILKAAASDNFPGDKPQKSCHMRDAFVQTYSFRKDLEIDGRRNKHVITFMNGKYWGIYELREAFETDYTDYYYHQPKDSIDNLAYWGSLQIRDGSDTGWVNLYNYVMSNPMTNATAYNYVDSKLSFKSLIDYMIYNSYVVNSDFINWNTAWWRGRAKVGDKKKWRYWSWDMDNVYDLGENFSGIPTTGMNADPCAYVNTFNNAGPNQGHPDILDKLMANPAFKSMYINRYADLLNTAFKCDSIMEHFNYFKNILTPEMPRQVAKWGNGSTLADWNKNMDTLQSKIQQRCSYIEQKIKDCYNVTGPYPVVVNVLPAGKGEVKLNTIWLPNYYWNGNYFGGVSLSFEQKGLDTANYTFDRWEFKNHTPLPSTTRDTVTINFTQADTVIAHYKAKEKKIDEVLKESDTEVIFPSAFTPNGDGNNDILFALGGLHATDISIEVWNRWGQLVYSSKDLSQGWDGNYKGVPAHTGVYAYLIKFTTFEGDKKRTKGNVTLLR